MPYSTTLYKAEIKQHFIDKLDTSIKILDVGAGCGTYAHLLREDFYIDAIEVFEPNIEKFGLKNLYQNVFLGNILDFDFSNYDYLIFGDIIEHLTFLEAKNLLEKVYHKDKLCMVGVPYLYEQGEYEGNTYEIHQQPDLTKEIFLQRYPQMHLLLGNHEYGYFINYEI